MLKETHQKEHTSGILSLLQTFARVVRRLELRNDVLDFQSSETGRKRNTDNQRECAETQSLSMAITTHCVVQLTV